MPQIPGYVAQIQPQGSLDVRATPGAFGAQFGAGMEQFGGMLLSSGAKLGDMFARIEDEQGRLRAYKTSTELADKWKRETEESVDGLDVNSPRFTEDLDELVAAVPDAIDNEIGEALKNVTNRVERNAIQSHMVQVKSSLMDMAARRAAQASMAWESNALTKVYNSQIQSITADSSNANLRLQKSMVGNYIGSGEHLPLWQRIELGNKIKNGLAWAQTDTISRTKPKPFLASVGGGVMEAPEPATARITNPVKNLTVEAVWPRTEHAESRGKQSAVSPVGAIGVAQVMPKTGPEAAAMAGLPWDPEKFKTDAGYNRALGQAYLGAMLKQFDGDMAKALAAYNWGPWKLQAAIKEHGDEWLSFVPKDTQKYISGILGKDLTFIEATGGGPPTLRILGEDEIAAANPDIEGWGDLTQDQKVKAVRQAEEALLKESSGERGELLRRIADANAATIDGRVDPWLSTPQASQDNLVRVLGPDVGNRTYEEIKTLQQAGRVIPALGIATDAQAAGILSRSKPKAGVGFAEANKVYSTLEKVYETAEKARAKDPIEWAAQAKHPLYKELDFSSPEAFGNSIGDRIALTKALRTDYGSARTAPIFSDRDAANFAGALSRERPDAQVAMLQSLNYACSNDRDLYYGALVRVSPAHDTLAFAGHLAVQQGAVNVNGVYYNGPQVAQICLAGVHALQGEKINDDGSTTTGRTVMPNEEPLKYSFQLLAAKGIFVGPNAQVSNQQADAAYQMVKCYIAGQIGSGKVTANAVNLGTVQQALEATCGAVVALPGGSTVLTPWGMSADDFKAKFPGALQKAFEANGLWNAKGPNRGVDDFRYMPADDGRYHVMLAGVPLVGAQGAVIVDMRGR